MDGTDDDIDVPTRDWLAGGGTQPQECITCADHQARVYNAIWKAVEQITWYLLTTRTAPMISRFVPPFTVRDHERRVGKEENALASHALRNRQVGLVCQLIKQPDFDVDSLIAGQPTVLVCMQETLSTPSRLRSILWVLAQCHGMTPCITRDAVQRGAAQSQYVIAEACRRGLLDSAADTVVQLLIDVLENGADIEWPESDAFRMGLGHMTVDGGADHERYPWISTGPVGVPLHCELPGVHWQLLTVQSVADIVSALRTQIQAHPVTWADTEDLVDVLDEVVNEISALQLRYCWLKHVVLAPHGDAAATVSVLLECMIRDAVRMCIHNHDTPYHIASEYAIIVGTFL